MQSLIRFLQCKLISTMNIFLICPRNFKRQDNLSSFIDFEGAISVHLGIKMTINESIEIRDGIFYILDADQQKWLFQSEEKAIMFLRDIIKSDDTINPEKLNILSVDTGNKDWKINSIPWSKIAVEIIKGD